MKLVEHKNPDGTISNIYVGNGAKIDIDKIIGNYVCIGNYAIIGNGAIIGNYVCIGNGARIGNYVNMGNGAKIGNDVNMGNDVRIGNYVCIGNYAIIGNGARVVNSSHATRSDGYVFTVCDVKGERRVFAGCRDFNLAEAKKHWNKKHEHYAETKLILALLFRK